ncbi:MAG: hypothetical protein AB7T63_03695 [Planctomycetota bacterium]
MHHAGAAARAACLAGLLLVSGLFAHADDRASPVDKQVEAARKQLVKDLHRVASWARDNKLFTWRVDVLREILAQDPGNRQARSALRHRWDAKTKTWDTSNPYEPPPDKDESLLPEAEAKRHEAHATFRDVLLALVAAHPELTDAQRLDVMEEIVEADAHDETARRALGDELIDDVWQMPEHASTRDIRAELLEPTRELAVQLARGVVTEPWGDARNPGAVHTWTSRRVYEAPRPAPTTPGIPVLRRTYTEGANALRLMVLGSDLGARALGLEKVPTFPTELILFQDRDQAVDWMKANPRSASAEDIARAGSFGALVLDDDLVVAWYGNDALRNTCGLSYALGRCAWNWLNRVERDYPPHAVAWMRYGLERWLATYLTRSRLPGTLTTDDTQLPGAETKDIELSDDMTEWSEVAQKLLRDQGAARLRRLMTARTNALTSTDIVVAWALAGYLLEGRPECVDAMAKACCTSHDADAIFRDVLQMDAETLARRVRRWLRGHPALR